MVEYLYKTQERAGGVLKIEGSPEIQWTAIQSEGKWYVVIHSDVREDQDVSLKCVLNMIQNSLRFPKAA